MFGEKKTEDEVFNLNTGETYNPNIHALKDEDINTDLLETIVQNIFRKA